MFLLSILHYCGNMKSSRSIDCKLWKFRYFWHEGGGLGRRVGLKYIYRELSQSKVQGSFCEDISILLWQFRDTVIGMLCNIMPYRFSYHFPKKFHVVTSHDVTWHYHVRFLQKFQKMFLLSILHYCGNMKSFGSFNSKFWQFRYFWHQGEGVAGRFEVLLLQGSQ